MGFSSTTIALMAAAGVAASAGGAAYSANAQAEAAGEARDANDAAISAQNRAFWSRNADARTQLDAEATAQQTAQSGQRSAFDTMRTKQGAALDTRDAAVAAQNQTAQDIRSRADAQQQQLLDNTNRAALDSAQIASESARNTAVAPAAQNIQTTNPLGTPGANAMGDGSTKQAYAARLAEAANNVRSYGQRLAQVSSYTAPLTTVGQAISQEQAGIMPVAAANQLLQAGQGVRLLPSQTAYDVAGSEGAAKQGQIAAALQGDLTVAKNQYQGSTDVANLQQGNTTQIAKNKATNAQTEAQTQQALGGLISAGGNIAAYGGSRYGASLNGAFGTPTPTPQPVAPPIAPGTIR